MDKKDERMVVAKQFFKMVDRCREKGISDDFINYIAFCLCSSRQIQVHGDTEFLNLVNHIREVTGFEKLENTSGDLQ